MLDVIFQTNQHRISLIHDTKVESCWVEGIFRSSVMTTKAYRFCVGIYYHYEHLTLGVGTEKNDNTCS